MKLFTKESSIFRIVLSAYIAMILVACGGGGGSSSQAPPPPPPNQSPTANAGIDQIIEELTQVTLSGSGTDSDGSISSLQWQQTAGTSVTLTNADTDTATFDAPDVTADEVLTFTLTVTDDDGATASDTVDITVGEPPTADAGISQFVTSGEIVGLDASASTDVETAILSYSWLQSDNTSLAIILDDINAEQPTFTAPELTAAETISFEVKATDESGFIDTATVSIAIAPVITQKMNDTGMTLCSDYPYDGGSSSPGNHVEDCLTATDTDGDVVPDGQDADYGRDLTSNYDSDGRAGFSFTKVDADGSPLPTSSSVWSCVRDNVTGLTWEVKTMDGGTHDNNHTYTWYSLSSSENGGDNGTLNGGSCTVSSCDTDGYVTAVNTQSLCGANNWRMPTLVELNSITDLSRYSPFQAVDTSFFPNIIPPIDDQADPVPFWTSTPSASNNLLAWRIYFDDGGNVAYFKSNAIHIRLVRVH